MTTLGGLSLLDPSPYPVNFPTLIPSDSFYYLMKPMVELDAGRLLSVGKRFAVLYSLISEDAGQTWATFGIIGTEVDQPVDLFMAMDYNARVILFVVPVSLGNNSEIHCYSSVNGAN